MHNKVHLIHILDGHLLGEAYLPRHASEKKESLLSFAHLCKKEEKETGGF
jgi:hypothetical protein